LRRCRERSATMVPGFFVIAGPVLRTRKSVCRSTCSRKTGCRRFALLAQIFRLVPWMVGTSCSCLLNEAISSWHLAFSPSSISPISMGQMPSALCQMLLTASIDRVPTSSPWAFSTREHSHAASWVCPLSPFYARSVLLSCDLLCLALLYLP
jgi:hypothetical protein